MLITGASRGIGAAVALQAAASGWDVCVNYSRDEQAAQAVAQQVRSAGRRALCVQADVSDEAQVVSMFQACDRELGAVGALVNNAGIVAPAQRVEQIDAQRLARVFAINVIGSFLCAREALVRMSTDRGGAGGAIVNLSSAAARLGSPNEYVDYAASKAAIDTFTMGLAKEVAAQGVRVNAVRPGLIQTEIHASGGDPGRVQRLAAGVPMGRGGTAEEVAAAVMWLICEQASYVTGALLDVGGGR
jgi:NAD(P)-dependent dehydrogenase (short-subunit alcohol dehydrogenase family)